MLVYLYSRKFLKGKNYSFAWSAKEENNNTTSRMQTLEIYIPISLLCRKRDRRYTQLLHIKTFLLWLTSCTFFLWSILYLGTDDFSFCSFPFFAFLYDNEGFLNCWVCRLAWNSKFDILDGKSEDLHVWWNMLAFPFSLFLNISSLSTVSTCYKSVSQLLPL